MQFCAATNNYNQEMILIALVRPTCASKRLASRYFLRDSLARSSSPSSNTTLASCHKNEQMTDVKSGEAHQIGFLVISVDIIGGFKFGFILFLCQRYLPVSWKTVSRVRTSFRMMAFFCWVWNDSISICNRSFTDLILSNSSLDTLERVSSSKTLDRLC